jgi:outer membrane protein OmpA-like peptidoglycan-associated protein
MKSSLAIALSMFAAAACAHREPVQHTTLSTVGNEDVSGDKGDPDNKKMTYTKVSAEDALNHDREHEEFEALNGNLNRGDAPTPALAADASGDSSQKCDLNVYFATASSELNERAKQQLNSIASCMKRRNVDDALVVGSADPRGSDQTNAELGKERARKVAEYLKELGVNEDEIRIRSVGESQASAQSYTWPASRRAEVQNK